MKRALFVIFGLLAIASHARAEQVVVAEAEYTHSAETTKDSHYRVQPTPETPADWTTPVDYAHGSVHVRLEVATKPSDTPTRYQICFEMKQNYCCTDQAPIYTAVGVYEWDTPVEKLWRPGPVSFAQGIVQSALILKDTNNVKPAPENVGEATSELYMPTDVHVVVTLVSAGDVYSSGDEPEPTGGASGSAGATVTGGAGSGGTSSTAGAGSAGMPTVESGGVAGGGSAAMLPPGGTNAGGLLEMAGAPPTFNAQPASSASCGIGATAGNARAMWLGLALLALSRRRRAPSG
jgi:hypothetical protein